MAAQQDKNLYEILGVTQGKAATADEIKKAFRIAVMKHHPDRHNNSPEATKKFQEINEANSILSDEKLRPIYDRGGYQAVQDFKAGGSAPGSTPHDPSNQASDARRRKRYTEQQVWDFFSNDGKPPADVPKSAATTTASPETAAPRPSVDRSEAIRRRQEQMARATGGNPGATPSQPTRVDTRALARAFGEAGQKAAEAAADIRGAPSSPEVMTEEARVALDGAHVRARQLLSEIEIWKTKFKR